MIKIVQIPWDSPLGRAAAGLRQAVFVTEQGFALEIEVDEHDPGAVHLVACTDGPAEVVGTLRMIDFDTYAKIGRVAVRQDLRGQGIGQALMHHVIALAQTHGFNSLVLTSQIPAVPFYARLGFIAEGETILEENVPHQLMRLPLHTAK